MIEVTRLNGSPYFLNPDQILSVEATPDTVLTLLNGEKLLVQETPIEISERFIAMKKRIYQEPLAP